MQKRPIIYVTRSAIYWCTIAIHDICVLLSTGATIVYIVTSTRVTIAIHDICVLLSTGATIVYIVTSTGVTIAIHNICRM